MRYQIDGAQFSTLEEFFDEVSRVLVPGRLWGHNLDGFNDILRGGFGTPSGSFAIEWKNHALSQERLGYGETIRQLELQAENCHPQNRAKTLADLATARAHRGPTVFDWLTGIIRIHGLGGTEAQDCVELILH
jgi:RNAse (barnase) inhibitor barstar